MAKTVNSFVSDQGEVIVTISSTNVTDIAVFTTAEPIILDGAVRSFQRTNNPGRPLTSTRVTGSITPIVMVGDTLDHEEWSLMLVDDYSEGATGEWGTDNLAAYEIFRELFEARSQLGGLKCTPAGGATGDIEYTLTNPRLLAVGTPGIDADSTSPEEVEILIAAETHSTAAHS